MALSDAQLRRILEITSFEYCDSLFWRKTADDPELLMFANCSDFFAWGCSDVEPIETKADVDLLERCLADLRSASGEPYPLWLGELYAARKRQMAPADFMLSGKYAIGESMRGLFIAAGER